MAMDHIIKHAEKIVSDRKMYKTDYNMEHVALYAYFYGVLTSILEHKQAPSKQIKEIHQAREAYEIASKILSD